MSLRLYVLRAVISPSLASNHHQTRHTVQLYTANCCTRRALYADVVDAQDATAPLALPLPASIHYKSQAELTELKLSQIATGRGHVDQGWQSRGGLGGGSHPPTTPIVPYDLFVELDKYATDSYNALIQCASAGSRWYQ